VKTKPTTPTLTPADAIGSYAARPDGTLAPIWEIKIKEPISRAALVRSMQAWIDATRAQSDGPNEFWVGEDASSGGLGDGSITILSHQPMDVREVITKLEALIKEWRGAYMLGKGETFAFTGD
jgi:hypothetical protein